MGGGVKLVLFQFRVMFPLCACSDVFCWGTQAIATVPFWQDSIVVAGRGLYLP